MIDLLFNRFNDGVIVTISNFAYYLFWKIKNCKWANYLTYESQVLFAPLIVKDCIVISDTKRALEVDWRFTFQIY